MNPLEHWIDAAGARLRVWVQGPVEAPALVLSHSLGTTLALWDAQAERLARDFRVVRYDTRGHGGSAVTPGPYTFDLLGADVVAILDALRIDRAHFCGISMGGLAGLWLGVHVPQRLLSLAVCNSAARIGPADGWLERAALVRAQGQAAMAALAASSPGRWFTPDFCAAQPAVVQRAQGWIAASPPEGYAACCEALAQADLRAEIGRIGVRTLIVAGSADPVTTVDDARAMQAAIANARLAELPASHLSNLEAPDAFASTLAAHLCG